MTFIAIIVVGIIALIAALACWDLFTSSYTLPLTSDEVHMVTTKDLWQVKLFRYLPKASRKKKGEPVLLCHGAASNQFNFVLPQSKSLVDALTGAGYDCWLIEFRGARSSVPPFGRKLREPWRKCGIA